MPQSFFWDATHYPDLAQLFAALPSPAPAWVAGLTLHHTWRPTAAQWNGQRTMNALGRAYRLKGWSGGPHLFVAPDGYWVGTPFARPGIHAGVSNHHRWGIEIVGDFDDAPWPPELQARVLALSVGLLHSVRADERMVSGHRECLPNKSCPGRAIHMPAVRQWIGAQLFNKRFGVIVDAGANVRESPRVSAALITTVERGTTLPAHPVRGSVVRGDSRWVRVRLPSGRVGYIWEGLGVLS